MNYKYVVVGTGLAAVGAVKALIEKGERPTVLDSGIPLNGSFEFLKEKLNTEEVKKWKQPKDQKDSKTKKKEGFFTIPKKLVFDSEFFLGSPSKNFKIRVKNKLVPPFSRAFGGLSNGWGAASLPPSRHDLHDWPISYEQILKYYEKVIEDLPLSAAKDSLIEDFPILKNDFYSLKLNAQDDWLIKALNKGRNIKKGSYLFGQARLLIDAKNNSAEKVCEFCSLCKSGCKYGSIYKATNSFMKWIKEDKINYISGITVKSYEEKKDGGIFLTFIDSDLKLQKVSCKKIFIGAGATPSSKIFLESNKNENLKLKLKTRGGYVLPVWRLKGFKNKKSLYSEPGVFIELRGEGIDNWTHIQISSSNELLQKRLLGGILGLPIINIFSKFILQHLVILLVNFHSNNSGFYKLGFNNKKDMILSEYKANKTLNKNLILSLIQIVRTLIPIGMIPLPFFRVNSGTYHVGGSLPMKEIPKKSFETDMIGRPYKIKNIHFIDSSVFPDLPGTTIGILSMANAYRIVSDVLRVHNEKRYD